jgi:hypothetical protein
VPDSYNDESTNVEAHVPDPAVAVEDSAEQHIVEDENVFRATIESMKQQASQDVREILLVLEKTHTGITEGMATAVGAGTGAAGSIAALSSMGTVAGLSGAGVSSGFAAAGGLIGGGMLVGIGVLAAPVAVLGVVGYRLGNKMKKMKNAAAVGMAAKRICDVRSRLIQHEEHFKDELAHINTTLQVLSRMKTV